MYEGMIVMTKYNQKFYKVEQVETNMSPKDLFITDLNQEVSFKEYYKQRYNIKLTDKQPLLKTSIQNR